MIKNIKYIVLGVIVTLSGLFMFLNQQDVAIDFLVQSVNTTLSSAIAIAFVLGAICGVLISLLLKSKPTPEKKMAKEKAEKVHGIPLE